MARRSWKILRLSLEWGATVSCVLWLFAGAGTLLRQNIVALVVIGGAAATAAVLEHGWHRAPVRVGTPVRAAILLVVVWAAMAAIGWYAWPMNPRLTAASPVRPHFSPLTLHQFFESDFPDCWGFGFDPGSISFRDGSKASFEARLLVDSSAGAKFVAFYLPITRHPYSAAIGLAEHVEKAGGLNQFYFMGPGPEEPTISKSYRFSGRVFIYHENIFTPEQTGRLHEYFSSRDLILELRGEEYARDQNMIRQIQSEKENAH